jgi:hypothetical protein
VQGSLSRDYWQTDFHKAGPGRHVSQHGKVGRYIEKHCSQGPCGCKFHASRVLCRSIKRSDWSIVASRTDKAEFEAVVLDFVIL